LEKRWFTLMQVTFLSIMAVVPAVMVAGGWISFGPGLFAAFGGHLAWILVIFISPLTVGFGHIRIDRSGLALWWGGLMKAPAEQLGDAVIVPAHEVGTAVSRARYRGIKIPTGHSSCGVRGQSKPAVFLEQDRPGKATVGWLLATRDPEAVVEALSEVRDGRRDG